MSSSEDDVFVSAPLETEGGMQAAAEGPKGPPPKKRKTEKGREESRRGIRITPGKRMLDFPGEFFERGDEMWCIACQSPVGFRQATTAKHHLASATHLKNKRKREKMLELAGPSAAVQNPPPESKALVASTPGICCDVLPFVLCECITL